MCTMVSASCSSAAVDQGDSGWDEGANGNGFHRPVFRVVPWAIVVGIVALFMLFATSVWEAEEVESPSRGPGNAQRR